MTSTLVAADERSDAEPQSESPDVLFEEARRRRRRRWLAGGALTIAAVIAGAILVGTGGGAGGSAGVTTHGQPSPSVSGAGPTGAVALAHDRWHVLARSPIGAPNAASVAWDGRTLLELGGDSSTVHPRALRTAAAFDPASGHWRRTAAVPDAVGSVGALTVWTGSRLFVFGGTTEPGRPPNAVAGLYDPVSNAWTLTPPVPARLTRGSSLTSAIWAGGRVIVTAITGNPRNPAAKVLAYTPSTNRWSVLPLHVPRGARPGDLSMITTKRGVVLWLLWSRIWREGNKGFGLRPGVDVFRLTHGSWRRVTVSWPQGRSVDPIVAGDRILLGATEIWCGSCSPPLSSSSGWTVNPQTLALSKLPQGPLAMVGPQPLWSGAAEITLDTDGTFGTQIVRGDIAFLDLATRRWYRGPRAPRTLGWLPAVWDGSHLFILDEQGRLLSYGP